MDDFRYVAAPSAPAYVKVFTKCVNEGGGFGSLARLVASTAMFLVIVLASFIFEAFNALTAYTLLGAVIFFFAASLATEKWFVRHVADQMEGIVQHEVQQGKLPLAIAVPAHFDDAWRSITCDTFWKSMKWLESNRYAEFTRLVADSEAVLVNTSGNDAGRISFALDLRRLYNDYLVTQPA